MSQKPIVWLGSSHRDLQTFPQDARRSAGFQLRQVQQGLDPADFKPMPSIGSGVYEIRVHTAVEHRVCYVAKFAEAIYVLHAFSKRTRKTSQHDVLVSKQRYQALLTQR
ncbi:MAG: type II toxin-antitoxin system RelE/ParE family toxin [Nitrospira sp.]|nr:type II toxin-antitoxin system RelE/ParE family toxin [Nitrospira sp.]